MENPLIRNIELLKEMIEVKYGSDTKVPKKLLTYSDLLNQVKEVLPFKGDLGYCLLLLHDLAHTFCETLGDMELALITFDLHHRIQKEWKLYYA